MKNIFLTLSLSLFSLFAYNQENNKVLMTIGGRDITTEEFLRVYNKNSNITSETEKKSIDDYLDLFINFKLKVIEAENLGYDTAKAFINELSGYKGQLAQPYLQVNEPEEKLIKEAYYRTIYEVRASHIMVRLPKDAPPADTLAAYNKIMAWRNRINAGEPFEKVQKESLTDPREAGSDGDLGYFSAFRMVYPFECAAYNTPVGNLSMPVRTNYGYHIIKVTDFRPERGSVKISHIMTRLNPNCTEPEKQAAREKIEKALTELNNGAKWDSVVQKYSENPVTIKQNGEIGWLKSGKAPELFLDECFKLEPNQHTGVIETEGGFHIALVEEKKPVQTFEEIKNDLKSKIENDAERMSSASKSAEDYLKKKYGCSVNSNTTHSLISLLDSNIYAQKWNASVAKNLTDPLITVGNKNYTLFDYAQYISKLGKSATRKKSYDQIVDNNIEAFASQCIQQYAIERLEVENLDFKYLLKEYHDGILLFNLTNDTIWKKAQEDSTGLQAFYNTAEKYKWNPRIVTKVYEYSDSLFTSKLPSVVKKQIKGKKGNEFVMASLCPKDSIPCVTVKDKTYEKSIDAFADKLEWKKGSYLSLKDKNKWYFYYVTNILPSDIKKLNEARGLYIADYQNYLENLWVKRLREKYPVKINQGVYNEVKSSLNQQK
jgi:peptidyl-prolyl cis-trans isomerase SurA